MLDLNAFLKKTAENCLSEFKTQKRILSFQQFVETFAQNPVCLGRNAPQYLLDCYEYYGTEEVEGIGGPIDRFKIFDAPYDNGRDKLVGQEEAQHQIHEHLRMFAATSHANRMLLIHGPNGSGKSSFIDLIVRGLEHYSKLDQGVLYCFNWLFTDRPEGKGSMGFGHADLPKDTLAFVDDNLITCKIPCELRENPLFLIPMTERAQMLDTLIEADPDNKKLRRRLEAEYLREGDLSAKSKMIYEALLNANFGDWMKVMRHVQVERYFISRRFGVGASVVVAQQSVDAQSRSMSFEQGPSVPPVLQGLKLKDLKGELIEGSGGVVEFSDLLKRPLEMNKYLLNTIERQTISFPGSVAHLNTVLFGTCNEKYLSAFKANPDFTSFKGRMELIRVGYLLEWKKEREVYRDFLNEIRRGRHVAPHTLDVAALWAVMTRLCRPDPEQYPDELAGVIRRLSPLEKAKLYGENEVPVNLKSEVKQLLRAVLPTMRSEHFEATAEFEGFICAAYEGRRGASAREVTSLLAEASEHPEYPCLSPLAVFDAIRELVKDTSVYDFLRLPTDENYNDPEAFVEEVQKEYLRWIASEVYSCMELIKSEEFERQVDEYFRHVRSFVAGEKIQNPRTGGYDDPSQEVMGGLEKLLDVKENAQSFRHNLITKIAAYSLEHPNEKLDYAEIFPDLITRLRNSYYKAKQGPLKKLAEKILTHGTEGEGTLSESERQQVERTLKNMREKHDYCDHCAKEAVSFLLQEVDQIP